MLLLFGCAKSIELSDSQEAGDSAFISISVDSESLTRGTPAESDETMSTVGLYCAYTEQDDWDNEFTEDDFTKINNGQFTYDSSTSLWVADNATTWGHNSITDKYTFFAYSPYGTIANGITPSIDKGALVIDYVGNTLCSDQADLVIATPKFNIYPQVGGNVTLNFETHALARLSLTVQTTGTAEAIGNNESFAVNGITFHGLYNKATMTINTDFTTINWAIDNSSTIDVTAAQNNTLKNIYTTTQDEYGNYTVNTGAVLSSEPLSVMADDKGIFVLPQNLSTNRTDTDAPTVQIRIRRTYYTTETVTDADTGSPTEVQVQKSLIYESEMLTLPPAGDDTGLVAGQHNNLSFTLDLTKLSEYETPLTLTSEVFNWTEAEVEADIHSNLYIYSSESNIAVEEDKYNTETDSYYGEFMICTNYDYNLRVPHHRVELDGTITSSRGFLFCSDDFNTYTASNIYNSGTVSVYDTDDYKIFVPTLLDVEGNEVKYVTRTGLNVASDVESVTMEVANSTGTKVIFGSHDFAFVLDGDDYRLLYYDSNNVVTAFDYVDGEIDLDDFAVEDEIDVEEGETAGKNTVKFKIIIGMLDDSGTPYSFDFSVRKSTRADEGLYTSTAIGGTDDDDDSSYGVNKQGSDPVYVLRLSVDPTHLSAYEKFDDIVGVEMISNGGGMITQLFKVTLEDTNNVIPN